MPQKRQAQVSVVELQQEDRHDEEGNTKRARGAEGKEQQQQEQPGLNVDCKQSINLPSPPQSDDPIITQFKPVDGQRELNDDNIKHIDPESGGTILHNYCCYINTTPLGVYRYLIETKGCDVNVKTKDNNTPLHYAFYFFDPNEGGNINVLMYLLTQTNINVNTKGCNDETLLHYVCQKINTFPVDVFKLLIERIGCDVNAQDNGNDTPLHHAFRCFDPNDGGGITVLTYLLSQNNVNADIKGKDGYTILHYACEKINRNIQIAD
jgi:ankyrin repeat protein